MTLKEFLVDLQRQEAIGVVAGNGKCRLGEVVGTEGSEAIDGVNVIVIAGDFGAQGGNDFAAGDGGCRGFDHRAEGVRNCEALFFLDLGGNLDGDFENGLDFGENNPPQPSMTDMLCLKPAFVNSQLASRPNYQRENFSICYNTDGGMTYKKPFPNSSRK